MTNSILINQWIYKKLSSNTDITQYVNSKIYPLVADQDVTYPFIVYVRNGIATSELTKDGFGSDRVNFQVIVVSNKYLETLNIANIIRGTLEGRLFEDNELKIQIRNCRLSNVGEDFFSDAYVQTLTFDCQVY